LIVLLTINLIILDKLLAHIFLWYFHKIPKENSSFINKILKKKNSIYFFKKAPVIYIIFISNSLALDFYNIFILSCFNIIHLNPLTISFFICINYSISVYCNNSFRKNIIQFILIQFLFSHKIPHFDTIIIKE
jgi:hypothetical protein